jgi:hypothetical protein
MGAMYTVLRKVSDTRRVTTPLVSRFRVPATTRTASYKLQQLEVICFEMLRAMENIDRSGTHHAYPTPSDACRWCDFRQPCDLADESPVASRAMLDRVYIRGGRHGRYDSAGATVKS